jgi:flagellar basal body P-ring protein FlgI
MAALLMVVLAAAGCNEGNNEEEGLKLDPPEPLARDSVVKDYARLVATGYLPVEGYGVVIGLGTNGCREIPGALRRYLTEYLAKHDLGSWRKGTKPITPVKFLQDLDTAVVKVRGAIPPGAPVGHRFDVHVEAMPRTGTKTLSGGILMPLDLHLAGKWDVSQTQTHIWAEGNGPMFVNPYLDPEDPRDVPKLRNGKVIGGGKVVRRRIIHLQLLKKDYSKAFLITNRINARFALHNDRKVAIGRSGSTVELVVPRRYRNNYSRFLELVLHLPLGYQVEGQVLRITERLKDPRADHDALALTWEAIGRQALTEVKQHYNSPHPTLAFYAARTGLRMGDTDAVAAVTRFANDDESPMQLAAVRELGNADGFGQAGDTLRKLLDSNNERVRTAAYESLLRAGETSRVKRVRVGKDFVLDLVESRGRYAIYATQTGRPKIVVFGQDLCLRRDVFYRSPDDMVTVSSCKDEDTRKRRVMVYRRVPRGDMLSDSLYLDFDVAELIKTLGQPTDPDINGDVHGLGLTYGEVLATLHGLCERGHIPAKFILQRPIEVPTGENTTRPNVARPDMPES